MDVGVALADGCTPKVFSLRLYARVLPDELASTGRLLAGNSSCSRPAHGRTSAGAAKVAALVWMFAAPGAVREIRPSAQSD